MLRVDHGDGSLHRIRAGRIELTLQEGTLSGFSAMGRVELQELLTGRERPLRETSSGVAAGSFDAEGRLAELTLDNNVRLIDRGPAPVLARADSATIDPATRRAAFLGQPARLVHSQGELQAASVVYDQVTGCSEARGEVQITLTGERRGRRYRSAVRRGVVRGRFPGDHRRRSAAVRGGREPFP